MTEENSSSESISVYTFVRGICTFIYIRHIYVYIEENFGHTVSRTMRWPFMVSRFPLSTRQCKSLQGKERKKREWEKRGRKEKKPEGSILRRAAMVSTTKCTHGSHFLDHGVPFNRVQSPLSFSLNSISPDQNVSDVSLYTRLRRFFRAEKSLNGMGWIQKKNRGSSVAFRCFYQVKMSRSLRKVSPHKNINLTRLQFEANSSRWLNETRLINLSEFSRLKVHRQKMAGIPTE